MSADRISIEFTGDTKNLAAATARVKADIASIGAKAHEQKGLIHEWGEEQGKVLTHMATGLFAVEGAIELLKGSVEKYKAIQIGHEKTGLSAEFLQKLGNAAEVTETDLNAVTAAAGKLSREIVFGSEVDASTQALVAMGFSLKDLQKLSPDELFKKVGDAISEIQDPVQRAAAAIVVFGKSGKDLIPVFEEIKKHSADMTIISAEDVENIDEAGKALTRLTQKLQAYFASIIAYTARKVSEGDYAKAILGGDATRDDLSFLSPKKTEEKKDKGKEKSDSKTDFLALLRKQQEAGNNSGKEMAAARGRKLTADDLKKIAEIQRKRKDDESEISQLETDAEKIRHKAALEAMSDQERLIALTKERDELGRKRVLGETEKDRAVAEKAYQEKSAEVEALKRKIDEDKSKSSGSGSSYSSDTPERLSPGTLASEQALSDFRNNPASYDSRGRMKAVSLGRQRALERNAARDRARETRRQAGGFGGSTPSTQSGMGEAERLRRQNFPTATDTGEMFGPPIPGSKKDMMGDGANPKGGAKDKAADAQSKLAADVAQIRQDISDRLPKKST